MHTSGCVELVGNLPTIVLPRPGAQVVVTPPDSNPYSTGMPVSRGQALCACANEIIGLTFIFPGQDDVGVYVPVGHVARVILPEPATDVKVSGSASTAAILWIEDLSAVRKEET